MKLFEAILRAYTETNRYLKGREDAARKRKALWGQRRMYNDHAYFVMLFGQLESRVNALCRKLIDGKRASGKWKTRRLWDSADIERMEFMRKVALLCEKGQAAYNRVHHYYRNHRCEIAHGGSSAVGAINLPLAAQELRQLSGQLRA